jgi:soluble lytic murein transglycosylase
MRGIVHTLSRLPLALFAGAAIIAGGFVSSAHGQSFGSRNGIGTQAAAEGAGGDEAAPAAPYHAGVAPIVLPRPLSAPDATIMRRVFALQAHGKTALSIRFSDDVGNRLLLGTVEADRLLGRSGHPGAAALSGWLARYHDLPDAPAIRNLLISRLPKGAAAPPVPDAAPLAPAGDIGAVPGVGSRAGAPGVGIRPGAPGVEIRAGAPAAVDVAGGDTALQRLVIGRAASGSAGLALRQIAARRNLTPAYTALLRAEVAQQLFLRDENPAALDLVQRMLRTTRAADQPALAYYIGGLAAWRLDRFDIARTLFAGGAVLPGASPRLRAALAFWASRASRPLLDARAAVHWLRVAAGEPLTFHGLLARRILRIDQDPISQRPVISQADVDAVAATSGGERALGLLQIGQTERAEWELRGLWPKARADAAFGRSLMLFAGFVGMPDLAAQLADLLGDGSAVASALPRFALPRLRPAGGFQLDPPLVYALARVESNFDTDAISAMGAMGLMQIMPETAQFITGNMTLRPADLHEPASNLAIGQRYLALLAGVDGIGDDLLRILASYNAGPGNLLRWLPKMHFDDDPLLFIETIPAAETRAFVPEALTYAWLYAAQMHLPAPSLEAIADGAFPRFTPESEESIMASR